MQTVTMYWTYIAILYLWICYKFDAYLLFSHANNLCIHISCYPEYMLLVWGIVIAIASYHVTDKHGIYNMENANNNRFPYCI